MEYTKFKTSNRVNVILYPLKNIHSVQMIIKTYGGNFFDGEKIFGMSHLLEHIILSSNKKEMSQIESYGGWLNGEVEDEKISFSGGCHYKNVDDFIDSVMKIVTKCNITNEIVAREKEIIKNEIAEAESDVDQFIWHKAVGARFANHYRKSLIDSKKTIDAISITDIKSFYDKIIDPAQMYIGVCGNFDAKLVKNKIVNILSCVERVEQGQYALPDPIYSDEDTKKYKYGINAAKVFLTLPGVTMRDSIKKRLTLNLIASALSDTHNSRLKRLLRDERNYAYNVSACTIMRSKCGMFIIDFMCQKKNVANAISIIKNTLKDISKNGLSKDEISHHKKYLDSLADMLFDYTENICDWLVDDMIYEREIVLPDVVKKIRRTITNDDIKKIARRVFDMKKLNVISAGNVGG